jgi:3-hydroxyacyl-[acyl-carrier-protein] dehydratase
MPPQLILDPRELDLSRVLADVNQIQAVNPHRFEMLQLSAIVLLDPARRLIAGYKDISPDEFWVRGHMPGYPLMPGVIMCEAAAQLTSYYYMTQSGATNEFIALAGLDKVRCRGRVKPGDRFVMVGYVSRLSRRSSVCAVQGFIDNDMVFECEILGIPVRPQ